MRSLTPCAQPGCPVAVDAFGCWCFEHMRHCPDSNCEHGAHVCEADVHFCDDHAEMGAEGRDAELADMQRIVRQIEELRAEKQRLADAGELSEAHGELLDAQIEGLKLRRYDRGDEP